MAYTCDVNNVYGISTFRNNGQSFPGLSTNASGDIALAGGARGPSVLNSDLVVVSRFEISNLVTRTTGITGILSVSTIVRRNSRLIDSEGNEIRTFNRETTNRYTDYYTEVLGVDITYIHEVNGILVSSDLNINVSGTPPRTNTINGLRDIFRGLGFTVTPDSTLSSPTFSCVNTQGATTTIEVTFLGPIVTQIVTQDLRLSDRVIVQSVEPTENRVEGQIWYNTSNGELRIFVTPEGS